MTPEFSSRRRFLWMGVFPASLLLIAIPLAPLMAPRVQQAYWESAARRSAERIQTRSEIGTPMESTIEATERPTTDPSVVKAMRVSSRIVARDVLDRLESETRQNGGKTHLTPLDVKRLQHALR